MTERAPVFSHFTAAVLHGTRGGRSAAESSSRWTMHRMRGEVPVLQFRVHDEQGFVGDADFRFPEADALGEVDGREKYLDPAYAPLGTGMKVYEEKRR